MTAALADPRPGRPAGITVRTAPRREPPFDDEPARRLTLVGPLDRQLPFSGPSSRRLVQRRDPFAARPTGRGELPDPERFGRRLLIGLFEAVAGRRSLQQLAPHLSQPVYAGLVDVLEHPARHRAWHAGRPSVRSVRLCEPADGVAELAVTIQTGPRVRAIAVRLEGLDGRWRCVRLQIG